MQDEEELDRPDGGDEPEDRRQPRGVRRIRRAVRRLSREREINYPIRSFEELSRALGGNNRRFRLLGQRYRVGELHPMIPSEYFPVDDQYDLVMKIASGFHAIDQALDAKASMVVEQAGERLREPPADASPPPSAPPDEGPKGNDLPTLRGRKRA